MICFQKSYQLAKEITKKGAKNFGFAFIFLPKKHQKAMEAIYSFARLVDDIADQENIPRETKKKQLEECRKNLQDAIHGETGAPLFLALSDTIQRFQIPEKYFFELIEGMEMDFYKTRYATFKELWKYCYHVASVVGLISLEIFGYKTPKAKELGISMGIALQLTNIIRDIEEDLERNRIYLPSQEMEKFRITEEELFAKKMTPKLKKFLHFQVERAKEYYSKSASLFPLIPRNTRYCPLALWDIYRHILMEIEKEDFEIFGKRIGISKGKKISLALNAWLSTFL
ncbi:MAG: phytoene/squalene synthase family protein [Planctomycetota bacterium]|nr:MAG: phytoene/squalene synthase family protein [Planctomycetota bacterium]